jgi:hypothetical protein
VASDAAPVSYLLNLGKAKDIGVDLDKVVGNPSCRRTGGRIRAGVTAAASKMIRAGVLGAALADAVEEPEY